MNNGLRKKVEMINDKLKQKKHVENWSATHDQLMIKVKQMKDIQQDREKNLKRNLKNRSW